MTCPIILAEARERALDLYHDGFTTDEVAEATEREYDLTTGEADTLTREVCRDPEYRRV